MESEYVAASDSLIMSETVLFRGFLDDDRIEEEPDMSTPDTFVDNKSAIDVAKQKLDMLRPRSRHVALRWHRVQDAADNIYFVPTEQQKADSLTKLEIPHIIRQHLFYHNKTLPNAREMKKLREIENENAIEGIVIDATAELAICVDL
jgi:hypothetical protein